MSKVSAMMYAIQRQYPDAVSTFGACSRGCGGSGRGAGACADCLQGDLAELTNDVLANRYHQAVRDLSEITGEIHEYEE